MNDRLPSRKRSSNIEDTKYEPLVVTNGCTPKHLVSYISYTICDRSRFFQDQITNCKIAYQK